MAVRALAVVSGPLCRRDMAVTSCPASSVPLSFQRRYGWSRTAAGRDTEPQQWVCCGARTSSSEVSSHFSRERGEHRPGLFRAPPWVWWGPEQPPGRTQHQGAKRLR